MNRRTALQMMGAFVACSMGNVVLADGSDPWSFSGDYMFHEKGLRNIIIERKSGKKIVIPFSEIFDALEKG